MKHALGCNLQTYVVAKEIFPLFYSLMVIGPSNPGEQRDKVASHGKNYAWIPVLWSSDNSRR